MTDDVPLFAEPLVAWRRVRVVGPAERLRLSGVGIGSRTTFAPSDAATCLCRPSHAAPPAVDGDCGFYAVASRERALASDGLAPLARVALAGDVLVHGDPDSGEVELFRAQLQQVLGLWMPPDCRFIARHRSRATAVTLHRSPTGWQGICEECVARLPVGSLVLGLAEAAGTLGVGLAWLDA